MRSRSLGACSPGDKSPSETQVFCAAGEQAIEIDLSQVQKFIFECVAVHNMTQCFYHSYCSLADVHAFSSFPPTGKERMDSKGALAGACSLGTGLVMLISEGQSLGFRIWGNELDSSPRSHRLGWLMWLQYHCALAHVAAFKSNVSGKC